MAEDQADGAITSNENGNVDRMEHWNSAEAQRRSLANLRPFGPDHRPKNPGRKRSEVDQLIRKVGRAQVPGDPKNRKFLQVVIERLFVSAVRGNIDAMRLIVERLGGRAMGADAMEAMAAAPTILNLQIVRDQVRFPEYQNGLDELRKTLNGSHATIHPEGQ